MLCFESFDVVALWVGVKVLMSFWVSTEEATIFECCNKFIFFCIGESIGGGVNEALAE